MALNKQTVQGPTRDGKGQGEPAQQIAEIAGDNAEQQTDLIGPEPMTGEPGPVSGRFPVLDPLLRRLTLVVDADDGPVRPGQGGDDEAESGKQLAEMVLDLGDDPPRPVPGRKLCQCRC